MVVRQNRPKLTQTYSTNTRILSLVESCRDQHQLVSNLNYIPGALKVDGVLPYLLQIEIKRLYPSIQERPTKHSPTCCVVFRETQFRELFGLS